MVRCGDRSIRLVLHVCRVALLQESQGIALRLSLGRRLLPNGYVTNGYVTTVSRPGI